MHAYSSKMVKLDQRNTRINIIDMSGKEANASIYEERI